MLEEKYLIRKVTVSLVEISDMIITRKMVPITGRVRSFLLFRCFQKQNREEGETE